MNKKQVIRLNESQLRRIVSESVKRVLRESSDSINPQPFGRPEDTMYDGGDADDEYLRQTNPWMYTPAWDEGLESLIELGMHCSKKFESGEWNIHNFLCDLDRLANGR